MAGITPLEQLSDYPNLNDLTRAYVCCMMTGCGVWVLSERCLGKVAWEGTTSHGCTPYNGTCQDTAWHNAFDLKGPRVGLLHSSSAGHGASMAGGGVGETAWGDGGS